MLWSSLNLPKTNSIDDFLISLAVRRHTYNISKQLKQCLLFLTPKAQGSSVSLFFPAKGSKEICFSVLFYSHEHSEGPGSLSGNGRRNEKFLFPMKFWSNFRKTKKRTQGDAGDAID